MKILVVESTKEYLGLIETWIKMSADLAQVEIITAKTRKELKAIIGDENQDFNVLFVAGSLERESIIDLCTTIRRRFCGSFIVAMSAADNYAQMQAGFDESLPKPPISHRFLCIIRDALLKQSRVLVV